MAKSGVAFAVSAPTNFKEFNAADLMGGSLGIEKYKNMKPEDFQKQGAFPSGFKLPSDFKMPEGN